MYEGGERMAVFLRVDINIISIILLGLVFLIAFKRLDKSNVLNRVYLSTVLIVMFQLFVETMTCIINGRSESWVVPMSLFFHFLLFASAPILTYAWYILIFNLVSSAEPRSFTVKSLVFIPVLVNIVFVLISIPFGLVFSLDASNLYVREKFFFVPLIFTYGYLVFGIIRIFKARKTIISEEFYLLIVFSMLPILGGLFQGIFYGTLLMWSSAAFALIFVFIYLQERMIHLDGLTGAWTRKSFDFFMKKKLSQRTVEPFSGVYFDINNLKKINDEFGHIEGDFALKQTVAHIKGLMGQGDIVARLGGDEFVIIIHHADEVRLTNMVNDIKLALSVYNDNSEKGYQLACSYGYGIFSEDFKSIEQFLSYIDHKMYANKR
ncbi:MAG TPA: GGDEF domain-containing protein [Acholeplasmataceae bacterium]|nr:GGDEF domain-containing protein [Acholeplasmataceae bacterium]HCB66842.1 GGDEF domain-containing protein [Acholeplasmataceae bacterium]